MERSVSSTPSSPDAMVFQILHLAKTLYSANAVSRVSFWKNYSVQPRYSKNFMFSENCTYILSYSCISIIGQALDLLVSVSLICYHTYTPDLSTSCSSRGLTSLRYGKSHLEVGFTLRCFQRLSLPDLATQLCSWRNNWYTRGQSIPVLSY